MVLRHAHRPVLRALSDTRVVMIHGPRQCGKSTLARNIANETGRAFIQLDDASTRSAARHDPRGFLEARPGNIVLDEVQLAPELLPAIKLRVDNDPRPGQFLLTGSADVLVLPTISESLAGRMEIVELFPFSQGELEGGEDALLDTVFDSDASFAHSQTRTSMRELVPDAFERALRGGYPEVLERADPERRDAWFRSYLSSILTRDVRDISNLDGLDSLPRLLALLAARTAGLLNASDLARSLALPNTSLRRYLAILEAIFLVMRIPPWSSNLSSRLVKMPKMMLVDSGLASHLNGIDRARLDLDPTYRGQLLENFVALELLKQRAWSRRRPGLFHFRTSTGHEVDFVLEDRSGRIVGIEVKAAATVRESDFKGLRTLRSLVGDRFVRGIVLYTGDQTVGFSSDLTALPFSAVWR